MSVNEKMTALADEVRRLSGAGGKLGIEAMTEKLAGVEAGGSDEKFKQLVDRSIPELTSEDLEGVTEIGAYIFRGCNELINVDISDTDITTMGAYAFANNTKLKTLILPNGLISTKEQCFSGCTALEYINIPDGVKYFGYGSLSGCASLKTVTFGASYKEINNYFFSGSGLTHLVIPTTITHMGLSCFDGLKSLQYIDFTKWTKVAPLNGNNFNNMTENTTWKIIVPSALYNDWINATNWAKFAEHIVPDTISGTWVFNDTITWERTFAQSVNFNTSGESKSVLRWSLDNTNEGNYYLRYGITDKAYSTSTQTWDNANYKTVSFGDTPQTCNAEFLAFMYHNATKQ